MLSRQDPAADAACTGRLAQYREVPSNTKLALINSYASAPSSVPEGTAAALELTQVRFCDSAWLSCWAGLLTTRQVQGLDPESYCELGLVQRACVLMCECVHKRHSDKVRQASCVCSAFLLTP